MRLIDNFELSDFLSLIGVTLVIYVAQFYYKYFTRINPLPGPFPFPIIGNLPQFYWHGGIPQVFYEYNRKKYGDLYEVYMGGRSIALNRPEHFEKILAPSTKSQYLMRIPHSKGFDELELTGRGILFNNNPKSWRYNRQFFSQAILSPKFNQQAIDCTNRLFNELEGYWNKLYIQKESKKENELDFSKWLIQYTNDIIITLLTGKKSYTMAAYFNTFGDKSSSTMIDDSAVELVEALRNHILGFLNYLISFSSFQRYIPYFKNKSDDFVQNMKFINQSLDATIKRRRKEIENTPLDEPLPHDMLTSVITANTSRDVNQNKRNSDDSTMRPMTDHEIRGIIFDGFLGGTDTTANSISYIIYYLAHYPDVKKKMLKEIDEIFQGDKTRPITENDLNNLKYCEAIVKEVGRIFPVVHMIGRFSERPDEIAGYEWPAGTWFRLNIGAVQRNEDDWEDPKKFNPDRWLIKSFEPRKNSFIMFGGGLRLCPGRKLAMIELVSLMALLFRKYEIDLVDMKAPLKTKTGLVVACTELFVKIKPRVY